MNKFKKSDSQSKGTCFLDVSAEEASNLLMTQGKNGSFIIRPSESDAGNQSLTVRHKDSVVHIKIQNAGEVYDLYGGEQFATLMELIDFYKTGEKLRLQNGDFICFTQPLNSDATRFRCERWFHGNISSSEAEGRLKKAAEHSFLVRECQSHQGDFVLCVRMGDSNVTHIIIKKQNTKYDIGDGALFNDLSKLIDNYRKNQITAMHNGKELKFTLQKAVNLGKIKASDISSRAGELAKRFPGQDKDRDGFWEEFEQITHEESASEIYTKPRVAGKQEQNIKKNRFKNILPYDETRVILKDKDESDYINANYIDVSRMDIKGHQRKYIATQGCLKNTAGDFWRMVWQEKSSIIVMTTCTVEMGKNKCYQYWPEEQGTSMTVELTNGSFQIEHVSEQLSNNFYVRVLHVTRESIKQKDKKQAVENLGTRTVYHFHYPEWPDKRAPKDSHTVTILQFIAAVNDKQKELNDTSPLIVHCSAGIGRTGTYILIDIFCNLIQQKGLDHPIDIPSTLFKLRQMRSGLVQTDAQYAFVYTAIREFVNHLMDKKSPPVQVQQPVLKPDESIYENAEKSPDQRSPTTGRPPVGQKPKLDPAAVYANCGGGGTVRN